MYTGGDQRQVEHDEHLRAHRAAYLRLFQTDLAHDGEVALVVIALGELLVVHDQHRGHDEQQPEEHAEEEQPAVHAVNVVALLLAHVDKHAIDARVLGKAREQIVLLEDGFKVHRLGNVEGDLMDDRRGRAIVDLPLPPVQFLQRVHVGRHEGEDVPVKAIVAAGEGGHHIHVAGVERLKLQTQQFDTVAIVGEQVDLAGFQHVVAPREAVEVLQRHAAECHQFAGIEVRGIIEDHLTVAQQAGEFLFHIVDAVSAVQPLSASQSSMTALTSSRRSRSQSCTAISRG